MDLFNWLSKNEMSESSRMELIHLYGEEVTALKKKYIRQILLQELRDKNHGGVLQGLHDMVKPDVRCISRLITLTLRKNFDPKVYPRVESTLLRLEWIKNSFPVIVLEQRSSTCDWYGYHVHILIKSKKCRSLRS